MMPNPAFDRISVEPAKCGGKPSIRGMRITVRRVLEILASHRDRDEVFRDYPFLEEEDLRQALRYAAASIDEELVRLEPFAHQRGMTCVTLDHDFHTHLALSLAGSPSVVLK